MKAINLLPTSEQQLLRQEKILSLVRRLTVISFLSYIIVIALLIGGRIYLNSTLSSLDTGIAQENAIVGKENNATLKKTVQNDNALISDYKKMQAANPHWSSMLLELASLVPNDVSISALSGDSTTGEIVISGKSKTRDSVLQLRESIISASYVDASGTTVPYFKNINLPLDNLDKPTNLDFSYSFFLNGKVLTQGK